MTKAVIFDMDGLLIDSEPLWEKAEIEVFGEIGVELTPELTQQTLGLRVDEVASYWFARKPWHGASQEDVAQRIVTKVIEHINAEGEPMPGVAEVMQLVRSGGYKCAIASSSAQIIIDAAVHKLGIHADLEITHSAQHEPFGKPHPGVYISAAQRLGVDPGECVALEDSINGVIAAKAAKMRCIAVPTVTQASDPRFAIADAKVASLADVTAAMLEGAR